MDSSKHLGHCALVVAVVAATVAAWSVAEPNPTRAFADTDPGTLVGEGGAFLEPVVNKLLNDDTTGLGSLNPSYANVKLDNAVADFVGGTAAIPSATPGSFATDYAVIERPLKPAELSAAKANGRPFSFVPFAATPVAIGTLVPDPTQYTGGATINSSEFCQHIPLDTTLLGDLYGFNSSQPLQSWSDGRINCHSSPTPSGSGYGISVSKFANADPTMENAAVMALLDSDPTSQQLFHAGLTQFQSVSTSTTPSESWPYAQGKVPGGDEPLIGKLLNISTSTNAPDTEAANWQLGAIVSLSSVWTGSPLGVPWNIPTAAVKNAAGAYVPPSSAAAAAAENDTTLASTADPATNNLVTFNASTSDSAAYNSYLMEEDYLVVPTSGLPAVKASKLAQLVRFALGPAGQKDITSFGAAPATPAMVSAGLEVAAALDAEALAAGTSAASGAGTPGSSGTAPGSTTGGGRATRAADSGAGSGVSASGPSLAFTGNDPWPVAGLGAALLALATFVRRLTRRSAAATTISYRPTGASGLGDRRILGRHR
jgi:ABC-type phosphate transport system substrate-binding protein